MVTEPDRKLIDSYFHYRQIGTEDVEEFAWFFKRNLTRAYPRYLLDLELELSKIPELVDYRRAAHVHATGSTTGKDTGKDNGTTSSDTVRNTTRTPNLQRDETHGGTTTTNDTESGTRAYNEASDNARTETGKKKGTSGGTDETTTTGKDVVTGGGTDTITKTGETTANEAGTTNVTGSEVAADVTSEARTAVKTGTEETSHGAQTNTDTKTQSKPSYAKHIEKALPMSSQYGTTAGSGGNGASDAYGMPDLNFQYASGQSMDETDAGSVSTNSSRGAYKDATEYKNVTDTDNVSGSRSSTRDTSQQTINQRNASGTNSETTTDTKSNNSTTDKTGTDKTTRTGTTSDETTLNSSGSDVKSGSEANTGSSQSVTAHGETVTATETGTDMTDETDTVSGTSSRTSETTREGTSKNKTDSMESGQNTIETEIRDKFRRYIENSQSILWLRDQLEICFLGVF